MLVDSHCHLDRLDLSNYNNDLQQALEAAQQNAVEHFLCVCIDLENFPIVAAIAEKFPNVDASLGIHPTEKLEQEPTIEKLIELGQQPSVIAIGETGLDYYHNAEDERDWQQQRFRNHIQAAKCLGKPLIVHTRQAREDTLAILREEGAEQVGGVMHCFTEDYTTARQALDLNFAISFSGIITFKNAVEIREVAQRLPLDKILIETDAPYLAPVPYRGKPNYPGYVYYVAECLAGLKNILFDQVAKQTTQNFFRLFSHAKQQQ